MEELQSGLGDDEQARLLIELDVERAVEFAESLSPEARERLQTTLWERVPSGEHPDVLLARAVDHPSVFARFIAYDFLGPREAVSLPGWFLAGYLAQLSSGEVVLERLAIKPEREDQPGITTQVLRAISPAEIVVRTRRFLAVADVVLELEQGQTAAPASPRRGRPTLYGDEHYEAFARELIADYEVNGRGVYRRAAKRHDISDEYAKVWAREATERGYLEPRERGQNAFVAGWKLLPRRYESVEREGLGPRSSAREFDPETFHDVLRRVLETEPDDAD